MKYKQDNMNITVKCYSYLLKSLFNLGIAFDGSMELEDGNVLLSTALLRLSQTSSTVNADNQTPRDGGIERTTVSSLVHTKNSLNPGDNLVRRWVGGLVQVDIPTGDVLSDRALQRRAALLQGSVMPSAKIQLLKVLNNNNINSIKLHE